MRHLFSSLVEVQTNKGIRTEGVSRNSWELAEEMFDPYINKVGHLLCRIDLSFMRPGKDDPKFNNDGAMTDRTGVLFCSYTPYLKVGHRLKCVYGPIIGSFDIRGLDQVLGYSSVSHIEAAVVEVGQNVRKDVAVQILDPKRDYK